MLPVSSSAHVIVVQRLLGLDPSAPDQTFLLVMLHTGTMFAVLYYFWPRWRKVLAEAPGARLQRPEWEKGRWPQETSSVYRWHEVRRRNRLVNRCRVAVESPPAAAGEPER